MDLNHTVVKSDALTSFRRKSNALHQLEQAMLDRHAVEQIVGTFERQIPQPEEFADNLACVAATEEYAKHRVALHGVALYLQERLQGKLEGAIRELAELQAKG